MKDNSFENNKSIRYSIPHVLQKLCIKYPILENDFKKYPFRKATESLSGFSYVQWSQMPTENYGNLLISKSFLVGVRIISRKKEDGTHELMMTNYENTCLIFLPVPDLITSYFSEKYKKEIQNFLEKELNVKIKHVSVKDAKSMWG